MIKSEYAATEAGILKRPIKSKHKGVIQGVPKNMRLGRRLGNS